MAKAAGVSRSTVQRIWDAHGLQPHRVTTLKLSKDPAFVEKLTDIVGLYLNPPDKAVVLCVDEKSQIQALDAAGHVHQRESSGGRSWLMTCGWRIRKNSIYRSIFMSREPEPSAKFSRWRA